MPIKVNEVVPLLAAQCVAKILKGGRAQHFDVNESAQRTKGIDDRSGDTPQWNTCGSVRARDHEEHPHGLVTVISVGLGLRIQDSLAVNAGYM
jgi:hypothetical protein